MVVGIHAFFADGAKPIPALRVDARNRYSLRVQRYAGNTHVHGPSAMVCYILISVVPSVTVA